MKKVSVFTSTRADYGLLEPLISKLFQDQEIETSLFITGTHLLDEFGKTINEIPATFLSNSKQVEIFQERGLSAQLSEALMAFTEELSKDMPDGVVILGDRFEAFSMSLACFNLKIPIAHLHGGEVTSGAIDDTFRHMMTKMSSIHFPCSEIYKKRIISMGENPKSVINTGALFVENIQGESILSLDELSKSLDFDLGNSFFLITYHPLTGVGEAEELDILLNILRERSERILITAPNIDPQYKIILEKLNKFERERPEQRKLVSSLGKKRYFSAIKHSSGVIGNSSSGLTEVPFMGTPIINIGERQGGRLRPSSVIDTPMEKMALKNSFEKLVNANDSSSIIAEMKDLYGNGEASQVMCEHIKQWLSQTAIAKVFYDGN